MRCYSTIHRQPHWIYYVLLFIHLIRCSCVQEEPVYPEGALRLPVDDNTKLTAAQYRERLYLEITNRRRDSRRTDQQRQRKSMTSS